MTHTRTAESVRERRFVKHYLVRCPFSKEEVVISTPDLSNEIDNSDPSKGMIKVHCCYCGHIWNEPASDVRKNSCDWKGDRIDYDEGK